jgi:hypothetical protein
MAEAGPGPGPVKQKHQALSIKFPKPQIGNSLIDSLLTNSSINQLIN